MNLLYDCFYLQSKSKGKLMVLEKCLAWNFGMMGPE